MAIRRTLAQFSDSIATADIAADAIDGTKIADNAIDSEHYTDGSIDNAHLADDAVGTDELANDVTISTSGAITTTGAFTSIGIDDNADALAITIDASENVGIGTTAPLKKLSVADAYDANTDTGIQFQSSSNSAYRNYIGTNLTGTAGASLMTFYVNSSSGNEAEVMVLKGNGNVGIGTGSPSGTLDVDGSIVATSSTTSGNITITRDDTTPTRRIFFRTATGENDGQFLMGLLGGQIDWTVTSYYGADAVIFKWDASDGLTYTKNGAVSDVSDVRLKKDIVDISDGLELLNQLRPVNFKFNGLSQMGLDDGETKVGFIADEVEAVAPFYVSTTSDTLGATLILDADGKSTHEFEGGEKVDDIKSLATGRFIPMMVKAIQELSTKNDALEAQVATLEAVENDSSSSNAALEQRILALENA
jgi:hypothetical protein